MAPAWRCCWPVALSCTSLFANTILFEFVFFVRPAAGARRSSQVQITPCQALKFELSEDGSTCTSVVRSLEQLGWRPPGGSWWMRLGGSHSRSLDPLLGMLVETATCPEVVTTNVGAYCPDLSAHMQAIHDKAYDIRTAFPQYRMALGPVVQEARKYCSQDVWRQAPPEKEPMMYDERAAGLTEIIDYTIKLKKWMDEHPSPEDYDEAEFKEAAAIYAEEGHVMNKAIVEGQTRVLADFEQGPFPVTIYLGEFFRRLVKAIQPNMRYMDPVCREGQGLMPYSRDVSNPTVGQVFQVHQWLSTHKMTREIHVKACDIVIDPKRDQSTWFRDISWQWADGDQDEVLGMLGLSLLYVSEPNETFPYHYFIEV